MANWQEKLGITDEELAALPGASALPNQTIEDSGPQHQEIDIETAQIEQTAKASLDFLAALTLPLVFKYLFPEVFKTIWQLLINYVHRPRDFSQIAIGLPRGFGKTLFIKIFIVYTILFTKKQFILIIAGTQTKANNIISDVMSMLSEPNVRKVFGDWKLGIINDRQELKRFGFRGRNIILAGAGADSDIRGVTLENWRPDLMIFDDIQTREDADSQEVSDKLETWMYGTAMKAKSPEGCLFVFIANMYPTKHSILRKLQVNPNWIKFIVGGILADGTSLWEELQPIKQLLKEFQNDLLSGHPEIFHAEVLNDPNASVNRLLDLSKLPLYSISDDDKGTGNFIVIDPSNDKTNSDAVSIGAFSVHTIDYKGKQLIIPVLKEVIEDRLSPGATIREALKLAFKWHTGLIVVESNAYQYSLNYWFAFICTQFGISGIEAVPIYSGGRSKTMRILDMFKQLMASEILYHPRTAAAVNNQITSFNPLKEKNVDGVLDLLTYAPRVITEFGHYIVSSQILEQQEMNAYEIPLPELASPF